MHLRRHASRLLVGILALLVLPTPVALAETSADVRRELDRITIRLQDAEARQAVVTDRLIRLNRQLAATEATLSEARTTLGRRVRNVYMSGLGVSSIEVLLTSDDPDVGLERMGLLEAATRGETEALRTYRVVMRRQRQVRQQVADTQAQIGETQRKLRRDTAALAKLFDALARQEAAAARAKAEAAEAARQARLRAILGAERRLARIADERARARARARAERLAHERERASRSSARVSSGGHTCPVGPAHSFADTWGAARSGGRRHQGTDVFAPYGSPLYAVVGGRVRTDYNRLGGIVLYLSGDDGNRYYYAHNSDNVARNGQRVATGELIARVGKSGNAQGTSPHVHFELHPGGGSPVNPYSFLRSVCG